MSHEVLYNSAFGGFSISWEAAVEYGLEELEQLGVDVKDPYCKKWNTVHVDDSRLARHDKKLIDIFKKIGSKRFSGSSATVSIATIRYNMYRIRDFDGLENVEEIYLEDDVRVIGCIPE